MQIVIGSYEILGLILLAVSFIGFYLGLRHGKRLGFIHGAITAEAQINHVFSHAIPEPQLKEVRDYIRVYLADPENMSHIRSGGHETLLE